VTGCTGFPFAILAHGMALLEVCCFSKESALLACSTGADRIELCDDRESGGITPPLEWVVTIKRLVKIPVFVMIRPRGGDFCYTEAEFETMKASIESRRPYASGFVFGVLKGDRKVDIKRTAELVRIAHPLPCTFHKAFDDTSSIFEALENVITTGCRGILTSGGHSTAHGGIETLAQLVRMSRLRISIMPGGSVRSGNIAILRAYTRAAIFHSSAVPTGATEPSAAEIKALRAGARDSAVVSPLTIEPPSPSSTQSSDDDGSMSDMLMSAVSIGTNQ
jgi:copper homeostasis protein